MASSISQQQKTITLLRSLYRELRPTLYHDEKYVFQSSPMWKYIMQLSRRFQITDPEKNPLTGESKNLMSVGQSYLSYLKANRRYSEISKEYKGKGELSTEEAATRMGFTLPQADPYFEDEGFDRRMRNAPKSHNPNRMPLGGARSRSTRSSERGEEKFRGYPRDPEKSALDSWESSKMNN